MKSLEAGPAGAICMLGTEIPSSIQVRSWSCEICAGFRSWMVLGTPNDYPVSEFHELH